METQLPRYRWDLVELQSNKRVLIQKMEYLGRISTETEWILVNKGKNI